ncbi:enterotoxin A family protein, partial [Klebsiella variicola]|uniref:enterotoxin A family protein n=2 Tax=Enterobacterales TaxID=91347 RepID=UPI002B05511B
EYAALGMIRFNQILGWRRSTSEIGPFIHNPAYNPTLYNSPTHPARVDGLQDPLFRLAGFPVNFAAWGESPWINFATCELRFSCSPKESNQHVAEDYMDKYTEEGRVQTRKKAATFSRYNFGLG